MPVQLGNNLYIEMISPPLPYCQFGQFTSMRLRQNDFIDKLSPRDGSQLLRRTECPNCRVALVVQEAANDAAQFRMLPEIVGDFLPLRSSANDEHVARKSPLPSLDADMLAPASQERETGETQSCRNRGTAE
jgi:hypothetical protein